jgi:hypothetical protein
VWGVSPLNRCVAFENGFQKVYNLRIYDFLKLVSAGAVLTGSLVQVLSVDCDFTKAIGQPSPVLMLYLGLKGRRSIMVKAKNSLSFLVKY